VAFKILTVEIWVRPNPNDPVVILRFAVRILKATVIYEIYLKFIKNINLFDRNHKNAF
jgi:hypothetical protein